MSGTVDFVAMLRAIANHIKKHKLADDTLLSVSVSRYNGVDANVAGRDACRRWLAALAEVSVAAHVYSPERIHVEAAGVVGDLPVTFTYVAVAEQEPEVHAALLALVPHLEPGQTEPIELPEILTGGDR